MTKLVSSPDLCVIQTEFSLYIILKTVRIGITEVLIRINCHAVSLFSSGYFCKKIHFGVGRFLNVYSRHTNTFKVLQVKAHLTLLLKTKKNFIYMHRHQCFAFYSRLNEDKDVPYLLSEEGEQYENVFKALRLANLINHHIDVEMLDMDHIIPPGKKYNKPQGY